MSKPPNSERLFITTGPHCAFSMASPARSTAACLALGGDMSSPRAAIGPDGQGRICSTTCRVCYVCDLDEMVWLQATGEVVDSQLHANAAAHVALASAPFGGGDRPAIVYTACGSERCEWLSARWPMICSGEQADAEVCEELFCAHACTCRTAACDVSDTILMYLDTSNLALVPGEAPAEAALAVPCLEPRH